jgi:hypothetical protein
MLAHRVQKFYHNLEVAAQAEPFLGTPHTNLLDLEQVVKDFLGVQHFQHMVSLLEQVGLQHTILMEMAEAAEQEVSEAMLLVTPDIFKMALAEQGVLECLVV